MTEEELQQDYDDFYEDMFVEMVDKYGPVDEMCVCDNLGEHLIGNIYVKFRNEEDADKAVQDLKDRWFNGTWKRSQIWNGSFVFIVRMCLWAPFIVRTCL